MHVAGGLVEQVDVAKMNVKLFNSGFLRKNIPVKVQNMASKWNATKLWSSGYLSDIAGDSTLLFS